MIEKTPARRESPQARYGRKIRAQARALQELWEYATRTGDERVLELVELAFAGELRTTDPAPWTQERASKPSGGPEGVPKAITHDGP
ncbi:hypothetical protein CEJ39_06110 [Rhodococcus pyridinivorans]|uniref:hypothetical protein n=1 Tax=Rhodococcus pyridinivorans TaxID=103816 RepID=UPI0003135B8B|nr:hypothetical protein [Rhodococcus pyridinivorans]AWZ23808.1 hypothetical protein CEJ39_06110 [Rhodococcus pyridinivorans]